MEKRIDHAAEAIRAIDAALAEESTLQEGLKWATEHNWMSEAEAEQCLRAYIEARNADQPFGLASDG